MNLLKCFKRLLNISRFFPDGRVIMVRTPNPPNVIVRKLKTREKAPFNVSPGFYQLHGNKVYLTLDSEDHKRPETMRKYGYEQDPKRKTIYRIVCIKTFIKPIFIFKQIFKVYFS